MGGEESNRLAGLHHQGLILVHGLEGGHDALETWPVPCSLGGARVDDELFRLLRRLQVVFQHAQDGFLAPSLAAQGSPTEGGNLRRRRSDHHEPPFSTVTDPLCIVGQYSTV